MRNIRYIKVTTTVSDITSNSAGIIGEVSFIGDGNRKYSIKSQGIKWGQGSLTDGTQIESSSLSFKIPLSGLHPDTLYEAKAYIVTDYYENADGKIVKSRDSVFGNIVDFKTLPETKKEDGEWVLINGVRWATCNIGSPGTFVQNPEDFGGYYQFNRDTTDLLSWNDYKNYGYHVATSWLPSNDPCPAGYHVPTLEEIESLSDTTYVTYEWTTRNGVVGGKFTDKVSGSSIFLPGAGAKSEIDGSLSGLGIGYYWNSLAVHQSGAWMLWVTDNGSNPGGPFSKTGGFCIRGAK